MAKKNQNNKSSRNVCEKLRNAINFIPFRRFASSHYAPTPPQQTTNNPIKAYLSQPGPVQFIPIETAAQGGGGGGKQMKPKVDKTSSMSSGNKLMFVAKEKRSHDQNNGGVVLQANSDQAFSEYITRVRDGMRTSSDLGIERIPTRKISRRDSLNDRVSSFLNRGKIKNKATSNLGHHDNNMHGNQNDY